MRILLSLRDGMGRFYGKHDMSIHLLLKFLTAFITFCAINQILGQMGMLRHSIIVTGLALLCAFLPSNSILLIGTAMILLHFYGISLEAAIAGGGILVIGMLLYFSVAPQSAMPLIVGAISMGLGIPTFAAVLFGLIGGPLSAAGVGTGVLVYSLMTLVKQHGSNLTAVSTDAADAMVEKIVLMINLMLKEREMLLTAVIIMIMLWIIWGLHRVMIRFSWMIAAIAGLLFYIVAMYFGMQYFNLEPDMISLGINSVVALLTAWFAQTLLFSLDFKKTETVRFEDDEYFYYVKAIPKRKIIRKKRLRRSERR